MKLFKNAALLFLSIFQFKSVATDFPSDLTERTAIISAFPPEMTLLLSQAEDKHEYKINGHSFITATLDEEPVLLLVSGISMINAAVNAQIAINRFNVKRIIFSGIAGGLSEELTMGDVCVPERWGNYSETIYAREIEPGKYDAYQSVIPPSGRENFGMIYPRDTMLTSSSGDESRFWFDVDPYLFQIAQNLSDIRYQSGYTNGHSLAHPAKLIVGGNGISGPIFMNNAKYREYLAQTYQAQVVDMETAAVAQLAYINQVPFIAFRSLSDLAGGGSSANEIDAFLHLAADNSAHTVRAFLQALLNDAP